MENGVVVCWPTHTLSVVAEADEPLPLEFACTTFILVCGFVKRPDFPRTEVVELRGEEVSMLFLSPLVRRCALARNQVCKALNATLIAQRPVPESKHRGWRE
jgi:hypothetical protein